MSSGNHTLLHSYIARQSGKLRARQAWLESFPDWSSYPAPARCNAIHEAGHVISSYRFGYGMFAAKVIPGRPIGGACHIRDWQSPHYQHADNDYITRRVIGLMAGPFAQARQSHKSGIDLLNSRYGACDLATIERLLRRTSASIEQTAILHARQLVRTYWPAINAIADLLQARGRIEDDEPDVMRITSGIERIAKLTV